MSRFSVVINGRGKNVHTACFEDFARVLVDALRALGHEVVPLDDPGGPGRLVMFGANNVEDPFGKMPADAICFNTEQVASVSDPRLLMAGFSVYRDRVVWDYSEANVAALKTIGVTAILCPVGYIESMTRIVSGVETSETISVDPDGFRHERIRFVEEDIDVLFYGAINERRKRIIQSIEAAGFRVVRLHGIYGAERDKVIARAKVVLNLHFYHPAVFEIFRVSHLLANRRCVVSESGGCDPVLESLARETTRYVSHGQIVSACRELVADAAKRREQAERGFEAFRKTSLIENVRLALEQS